MKKGVNWKLNDIFTLIFMKKLLPALLLFSACASMAQNNTTPPESDYAATWAYQDSLEKHENPVFQFYPHVCTNRYGKKAHVGKLHRPVTAFEYDAIPSFIYPLNVYQKKGWQGVVTDKGKVVVPFQYQMINTNPGHQVAFVKGKEGLWGAFDQQGKRLLPEKYKDMMSYQDTLIRCYDPAEKRLYLFNQQGKTVKSMPYAGMYWTGPNRYIVSKEGPGFYWLGVIDEKDRELVPLEYPNIEWARGDWALVTRLQDGVKERGLYQVSSQRFSLLKYPSIFKPDQHFNMVFISDKLKFSENRGLLDSTMREIYPPLYREIKPVPNSNYYMLQTNDNRWGIGDKNGKVLITPQFSLIKQANTYPLRGEEPSAYYTAFWECRGNNSRSPGLWHPEKGLLFPPDTYAELLVLTDSTYLAADGTGNVGLYSSSSTAPLRRYTGTALQRIHPQAVQIRNGDVYEVIWCDGSIPYRTSGPAQQLNQDFYALQTTEGFGLYDKALRPLTPHRFFQLRGIHFLEERYWKIRAEQEDNGNYGAWVAFGKESLNGPVILIDNRGKTFTINSIK
jgi:hypothetical protein